MPASGKSTVGKQLAKTLDIPLIDIDSEMEHLEGMSMSEMIATKGAEETLAIETSFIRNKDLHGMVVSTPGSIVYNDVLDVLREQTCIVWLNVTKQMIAKRLDTGVNRRRIIALEQKGFDTLFDERTRLYKKWATYTINCDNKNVATIVREIISKVGYNSKGIDSARQRSML